MKIFLVRLLCAGIAMPVFFAISEISRASHSVGVGFAAMLLWGIGNGLVFGLWIRKIRATVTSSATKKQRQDPVIGFLKRGVLIFAIQAAGIVPLGYLLLFLHWQRTGLIVIISLMILWTFFAAWLNQRIKHHQQKPSAARRSP